MRGKWVSEILSVGFFLSFSYISTGGQGRVNYSGLYNCLTRKHGKDHLMQRFSPFFFPASIWWKLPPPPINKGKKVILVRITHLVQPFR